MECLINAVLVWGFISAVKEEVKEIQFFKNKQLKIETQSWQQNIKP